MTDTRKDKRAPLSLKVRFKSATLDEFVEQYSQDISRGGIFIKSKKPMKIGTLLKFEFQLKDESSLIHGVGRVVWVRAPEEATDASPAGMGIKFIKMDADSRALVQDIVDRRGGGSGAFEAGETGADAGDEGGSFFPDSGPAQLPPPEDRTSVRHASEFLAEALMGAGVSAADEAKESAEEARRRGAEIQKKREEEAKAREAAAAAAKRAAEVPKGSASAPTIDEEAKPRRAAPAEVTGTDEIPTLIASRAELDAAREEAESATTLAEEPKAKPKKEEPPKATAKEAPKEEPRAAAKEPAKAEPAKEPAKAEPAKAAPKKDETPRLVMPNEPERPPPPKEPSSMPIVVIVLVLVALGVGGWFFFLRDSGEAEPTTPVAQPTPESTPEPTPEPTPEVEPEPEPEPEPVATTRVRVTSTPAAEIFVGGTSVGTTTAEGLEIELPIGVASTVEARAAGFGSSSLEVTPAEGTEPDPITFRLAALPYVIEITTEPSGARVSANNRNVQSPGEVRLERWTRDVSVFANLTGYNQGSQVVRQTDFVERDGAMRATVRIVLEARATVVPSMTTTMVAAMTETTMTESTETAMTAMTEEPAMVEEPPAMVEEPPAMVEAPPPAMVEAPPPAMTEEPVPDNPF